MKRFVIRGQTNHASRITNHEAMNESKQRVINVEEGNIMVVTDLHGDGDAYQRYRDRFLALQAQGKADVLVLNGDLIHYTGPEEKDKSLEMVLDVLALKEEFGDKLIYLLGNHEIPHIYSFPLQKGDDLFTPRFEWAMGTHRDKIIALFDSLPFFMRTPGGVSITHAGASNAIYEIEGMDRLFNFSHRQTMASARDEVIDEIRPYLIQSIEDKYGLPYEELVHKCFAVQGPEDPRYEDFLTATIILNNVEDFNLLWAALFSRNEKEYPEFTYNIMLRNFLQLLSAHYKPQRVLVTGHINCRKDGYKIVNEQQLRIASAKHAIPREAGKYLLFNANEKVSTAKELISKLHSVFE